MLVGGSGKVRMRVRGRRWRWGGGGVSGVEPPRGREATGNRGRQRDLEVRWWLCDRQVSRRVLLNMLLIRDFVYVSTGVMYPFLP